MFDRKKRRVRKELKLAFEVLEHRTLLAASPISIGVIGYELGPTGHPSPDHGSRPGGLQAEVAHVPLGHGDIGRRPSGDANRTAPRRGSHANGLGDPAPPTPVNGAASMLPPLQLSSPPAVPGVFTMPTITSGFVAPPSNADLPTPTQTVGFTSSLTVQFADLSGGLLPTDLRAEGEFAATFESLRDPGSPGPIVVNSLDASVSSESGDTNTRAVFTTMADSDLLTVKLAFLDEIVESGRTAANHRLEYSLQTAREFDWYSPVDGLYSEVAEAEETTPFHKGFIDIGESIDEVFSERSTTMQDGEGDPSEVEDGSTEEIIADHVEQHRVLSSVIWRMHQARQLAAQAASDADSSTQEQSDLPAARGGMVQLAHADNSLAEVLPDAFDQADLPAAAESTFLKMDGAVVRYQAFEVTPLPAVDDSEPLSSADSDTSEQPSTGNVSTAASDPSSPPSARALASAGTPGFHVASPLASPWYSIAVRIGAEIRPACTSSPATPFAGHGERTAPRTESRDYRKRTRLTDYEKPVFFRR